MENKINDIVSLEDGKLYVQASRNVIIGRTTAERRKEISAFFSALLKDKPCLDIPTIEGDVLTITKDETADKARDKYKYINNKRVKMSDDEFVVKLHIEAHIDEVAEISTKVSQNTDKKNHIFAEKGFTYRKAYFKDFDDQYYEITMSIGHRGTTATVYNVGKIKESISPSAKIIAAVGSKPLWETLSDNSITQSSENVNGKNILSTDNATETGEQSNIDGFDYNKAIDCLANGNLERSKNTHLELLNHTPQIYIDKAGAKDLKIIIAWDVAYLAMMKDGVLPGNYHNLGIDVMKDIPRALEDPLFIIKQKNGRIIAVTEIIIKGNRATIASIELDTFKSITQGGKFSSDNYNLIVTIMDAKPNYLQNTIFGGDVVYNKSNEDLAHFILRLKSLKKALPNDDLARPSNSSITQSSENVNSKNSISVEGVTERKNQKTMKDKEQLKEDLRARVEKAVESYRENPQLIAEYLRFAANFNKYSHKNLRLIWAQDPHARFVASASAFNQGIPDKNGDPISEEKIFVKKGEHALYVWCPKERLFVTDPKSGELEIFSHLSKTQKAIAISEGWEQKKDLFYILVPVFDIAQTTAPPELYPRVFGFGGNVNQSSELQFEAIKSYAENVLRCDVEVCDFGKKKSSLRGTFSPSENKIRISDMLSGDGKLSTLIHELGHAELHSTLYLENDALKKSTAQVELEADMYSLMVESRLGIEPTNARCAHLSEHYGKYLEEVKSKLPEGKTLDLTSDSEAFSFVIERYKKQAPIIEDYIKRQASINAQYDALGKNAEQSSKNVQEPPLSAEIRPTGRSV